MKMTKVDETAVADLTYKIKLLKGDVFKQFIAEGYVEELKALQLKHRKLALKLAKMVGLTYLYIGEQELCGCEGIQYKEHVWHSRPAVWCVKEKLGLTGSCGNGDQYQIRYGKEVFGDECGAWHVVEDRRLTPDEEFCQLKFAHVVEADEKRRQRHQYQYEP